jgi:hypothetical protein
VPQAKCQCVSLPIQLSPPCLSPNLVLLILMPSLFYCNRFLKWGSYPVISINNSTYPPQLVVQHNDTVTVSVITAYQSKSIEIVPIYSPLPGDWFVCAYSTHWDEEVHQKVSTLSDLIVYEPYKFFNYKINIFPGSWPRMLLQSQFCSTLVRSQWHTKYSARLSENNENKRYNHVLQVLLHSIYIIELTF